MSVGGRKEMWKCSSVLLVLHTDTCPFVVCVVEKEGIASSRRIVRFLLIDLPPVSVLLALSEGFLCDALATKLCCLSYLRGEHWKSVKFSASSNIEHQNYIHTITRERPCSPSCTLLCLQSLAGESRCWAGGRSPPQTWLCLAGESWAVRQSHSSGRALGGGWLCGPARSAV